MARIFAATTGSLSASDSAVLNPIVMSFSAKVKFTNLVPDYSTLLLRIDVPQTHYYQLAVRSTGKLAVFITTTGASCSYNATGANTLSSGVWYNLSFTKGASGFYSYVNMTLDKNIVNVSNISSITGTTGLCLDASSNVTMADAALWNIELLYDEIVALSNGARPFNIRKPSLIGYWPLDGFSSPEPDLSGNAFNGTLAGTAFAPGPPMAMFTPRWPMNELPSAAAPTFISAWATQTNLPVLGTGIY